MSHHAEATAHAGARPAAEWPGLARPFAPLVVPRLADRAVLRFTGGDARDFLSRQLTCEVGDLRPGHARCGGWLTPKGRALALLELVDAGDGAVHAVLPMALADGVRQRLALFVMRDDVTVGPCPDLVVAGLAGDAVPAARAACGDDGLPAVAALDDPGELALLVGDTAAVDRVLAAANGWPTGDDEAWRRLQVAAGLPEVLAETREAFVPQMINLDRIGAVSFAKGCYPGQEIVARTQHLGRIKRRMFRGRAHAAGDGVLPGTAVHTAAGREVAGRVVLGARADGDGTDLLAVLSLEAVAAGEALHLGAPDGPAIDLFEPPYPLQD